MPRTTAIASSATCAGIGEQAILSLTLNSGECTTREPPVGPEDRADPVTGDRLFGKFKALVQPFLREEETGHIAEDVMELEKGPSLARFMERYSKL